MVTSETIVVKSIPFKKPSHGLAFNKERYWVIPVILNKGITSIDEAT